MDQRNERCRWFSCGLTLNSIVVVLGDPPDTEWRLVTTLCLHLLNVLEDATGVRRQCPLGEGSYATFLVMLTCLQTQS